MAKLSREEIINLYKKPKSMTPMEIWRHSGYFNSITTIRKYIKEAIESGEVTNEDEEVFRQKKEIEKQEKEKRKTQLKAIILKKIRMNKSRKEIVQEIECETGWKISTTEVGTMIEQLIQEKQLTEEEYKGVLTEVRKNAIKKVALTKQGKRSEKEGLEL